MSKKRNFRKRNHSDDAPSDSDDDNATELGNVVEVTKAVQTMRHRQSGITAEDLYKGKVIVKETKKESLEAVSRYRDPQLQVTENKDPMKLERGGCVDMKALKRGITDEDVDDDLDIGTSFAAETNRRDEDADMVKYVEEELAKRKGFKGDGEEEEEGEEQEKSKSTSAEDALYELPEYVKELSQIKKKNEDMLSNQMLSGIPEIDLGIDAKIKNIEATEDAKQRLIKERRNKREQNVSFVPTNMAVNFVQHNRFNIEDHKPPQQKRVVEAPKPEPLRVGDMDRPRTDDGTSKSRGKGAGGEKATDDFHYEKFKKQLRRY